MDIAVAQVVRTETTKRLELDGDVIRGLLASRGVDVPRDARITVTVPGGGDWSNTDLEVDARCPVVVTWTEVEQS